MKKFRVEVAQKESQFGWGLYCINRISLQVQFAVHGETDREIVYHVLFVNRKEIRRGFHAGYSLVYTQNLFGAFLMCSGIYTF